MENRLAHLRTLLTNHSLDSVLISSVPDIIYLTNFSSFSLNEREAFLLITTKAQYIFTDGRYSHAVKTQVKDFQLYEIGSGHKFIDLLEDIRKKEQITSLGIDKHNVTAAEFETITQNFKQVKHFSPSQIRVVKTADEIKKMQQACAIGDKAFSYILKKIKAGMTEKEVAFELEHFIRKQGADISFATIVAFNENAAIPHHHTGDKKLNNNGLILLDFGVQYENYCSDMTRTIFIGKATAEQKKVYETVHQAQEKAIEYIQQGCHAELVSASTTNKKILKHIHVVQCKNLLCRQVQDDKIIQAAEADKVARDYIISKGYLTIPHSLGHGIGLEVHEAPTLGSNSTSILENGMVFSIEPGIYLPNNLGVRIEDLFAIQNNKLIHLTQSPRHLIEL